jgi:hypothetical protein
MRGALVEVLLVLAVGMVVIGVYRGWFTYSAGHRIRPISNDSVQSTAPIAAARLIPKTTGKRSRDLR